MSEAAQETEKVRHVTVRKAKQEPALPASESAQIVALIDRLARDPAVDVDKMERIMRMQMELVTQQSKRSFAAALAEMQPKLPVITERGVIEVRAKDPSTGERTGKILQSTKYALWEDINDAIKPVLHEHGFSLSFRTGTAPDGKLTVTGILGHRDGHQEETTIPLMHDTTGSKNAVQAVGSSTSYGKRYTACALLNITSRGEDDDGKSGGAEPRITEEQVATIRKLIMDAAPPDSKNAIEVFRKWAGLEHIEDMLASQYDKAIAGLKLKISKKAKAS